jgi:simple sugar transport system permease protein
MKFKFDRRAWSESEIVVSSLSSVLAIAVGLLFGFLLMVFVSPSESLEGFRIILTGGFNDGLLGIGSLIVFGTPLIFAGLSVAFAYRTGLFNIGASGQMMMGALAAVAVGVPQWWR